MHATTKIKWGMPDSLRSPRSARHTEGLPCSYLARERAHADYGIRSKKTLRRKLQTCSAGHLRRSRQQKRKICGQRTPSAPSLSPPSRDVCFFSGSSPPRGQPRRQPPRPLSTPPTPYWRLAGPPPRLESRIYTRHHPRTLGPWRSLRSGWLSSSSWAA